MNKNTREIRLYAANGAILRFTLREMLAISRNFHFATFVIFAALAIFISIFSQAPSIDSVSILAFIFGTAIYFATYAGLLTLMFLLPEWRIFKNTFSPILCFGSAAVALFLISTILMLYDHSRSSLDFFTWKDIGVYYILIIIFDSINIIYVAPEALKQDRAAQSCHDGPADEAEESSIKTANMKISKSQILYISAGSHHVNFITKNETLKSRARMSDIVAQTKPDEGIQIHRSHWVARHGIMASSKKNGKLELKMKNSVILTVSRGRQAEVQSWLKHAGLV